MGKRSDADHRTSQDAPIAAAHICSCLCHASVQVVCVVVWFQCVRVCDLLTTFCVNHGKVNDRQDVKRVPLKCPNMVAAGPPPQRKKKIQHEMDNTAHPNPDFSGFPLGMGNTIHVCFAVTQTLPPTCDW